MSLTQQQLETALTLLGRCDLKGVEVPAFVELTNAIQRERAELIAASLPQPTTPAPDQPAAAPASPE